MREARQLKLKLFQYIDDVIDYKQTLRFEIEEAKKVLDQAFLSMFQQNECFVNYTSRIKEDASLKEKLIRQNFMQRYQSPEETFDHISDVIGCRVECRFINDEEMVYRELFRHFPRQRSDGYYQSDRDPRLELKLSDRQPQSQKNGFPSYRIDGHFFGNRVLNFELQIKSIVNVFWNEIDHKILYKNYNYVVTEKFVREIMSSIKGDLNIIDKQMQMVYEHLRRLDNSALKDPSLQIQSMIGRMIQDIYVVPLRESEGYVFDFRPCIDLLTEFLFARVRYESRENFATEFVRIMEEATHSNHELALFGEMIYFDPPIDYHNQITEQLGSRLEEVINQDIRWNLLIHILFDLNPEAAPRNLYRSFVDYLYFRLIHTTRTCLRQHDYAAKQLDMMADLLTEAAIDYLMDHLEPEKMTLKGTKRYEEGLCRLLEESPQDPADMESLLHNFRTLYPGKRAQGSDLPLLQKGADDDRSH